MNDLQLVRKNKGIKEHARLIYLTNECKSYLDEHFRTEQHLVGNKFCRSNEKNN